MKTLKKNEEIKGKIVTFNSFREMLLSEFNKNFPDEYEDYVKLRADISPQVINSEGSTAAGGGNEADPLAETSGLEMATVKKEEPVQM